MNQKKPISAGKRMRFRPRKRRLWKHANLANQFIPCSLFAGRSVISEANDQKEMGRVLATRELMSALA